MAVSDPLVSAFHEHEVKELLRKLVLQEFGGFLIGHAFSATERHKVDVFRSHAS